MKIDELCDFVRLWWMDQNNEPPGGHDDDENSNEMLGKDARFPHNYRGILDGYFEPLSSLLVHMSAPHYRPIARLV